MVREMVENTRETADNGAKDGSGPSRIRTCNQGIMSELATPPNSRTDQVLTTDAQAGLHTVCTELQTSLNKPNLFDSPMVPVRGPKCRKISMMAAALQVLQRRKLAMTCPEIIDVMATEGLWVSPCGKTPSSTLYAAISRRMRDLGNGSPFKKVERGRFIAT